MSENILCFGLNPNFPSTEYGYIKSSQINSHVSDVILFCEKPDLLTANKYFDSDNFFWNSGIILSRVDILLQQFELYYKSCNLLNSSEVFSFKNVTNIKYNSDYLNTSIDYAILEKSNKIKMIKLIDDSWTDLGSHYSLSKYLQPKPDINNNTIIGNNIILSSVKDCIIINPSNVKTSVIGIESSTVIIAPDGTLVMKNGFESKLSKINFSYEDNIRPWGFYDILYHNKNIKIKLISINPHSSISLQMHNFRSEYWFIIEGNAAVINGSNNFTLSKGESTFIEKNSIHRLENINESFLLILEVQFGDYLGEDDIIRLDDKYNRI